MSSGRPRPHKFVKDLPAAKKAKSSNFDPVLRDIRDRLKRDWCFYEEALEGMVKAGARGGDASGWVKQMEDVVNAHPIIEMSHAGVMFLLEDMGIQLQTRIYPFANIQGNVGSVGQDCQALGFQFAPATSAAVSAPAATTAPTYRVAPMGPPPLANRFWQPIPLAPTPTKYQKPVTPEESPGQAKYFPISDFALTHDFSSFYSHRQPASELSVNSGPLAYNPHMDELAAWQQLVSSSQTSKTTEGGSGAHVVEEARKKKRNKQDKRGGGKKSTETMKEMQDQVNATSFKAQYG
ncbi:hypothetical protein K458DRAFT_382479 [Lentithecium fluviatile CBS 122367]|uniref:Uncharacterized protein n=1 Tax=Lentithecium fluviatile CBS 122367 TaxID=1168545 RepID=A0A6G1JKZ2_9PLEO|nr:hypothetical protein K458DRAFT_382479 [Lentithecium fluviatile CBS 122367]